EEAVKLAAYRSVYMSVGDQRGLRDDVPSRQDYSTTYGCICKHSCVRSYAVGKKCTERIRCIQNPNSITHTLLVKRHRPTFGSNCDSSGDQRRPNTILKTCVSTQNPGIIARCCH